MTDPRNCNTTALAFVGDAVYELYVRDMVSKDFGLGTSADTMHKASVKYVRAESQARALKKMMSEEGFLKDDEVTVVKRARNHKFPNRSRSAGAVEYKLATAFEALIGYLHQEGSFERQNQIMATAVEIINER